MALMTSLTVTAWSPSESAAGQAVTSWRPSAMFTNTRISSTVTEAEDRTALVRASRGTGVATGENTAVLRLQRGGEQIQGQQKEEQCPASGWSGSTHRHPIGPRLRSKGVAVPNSRPFKSERRSRPAPINPDRPELESAESRVDGQWRKQTFATMIAPLPDARLRGGGRRRILAASILDRQLSDQVYTITAKWDGDAAVWVATSDEVPGLVTEAGTLEDLVVKLRVMVPEMLEANGVLSATAAQQASFKVVAERLEHPRAVA